MGSQIPFGFFFQLLSFGISQTLESTFATVGEGATFGLYGVATALSLWFAWARVPETSGVALEDVSAGGQARPRASR